MAPRLLLVLFSLVPALIAGQKYLGGGSMASFYPYELTDDENGDRGGRFIHHYDSKNEEQEDDDDNTSNEIKPWRRRFNLLNTDLQVLKNMKRSEKRHHLADSAEIALKRHHSYNPVTEADEDDVDNTSLKNGFQASFSQQMRRHPQANRRRLSPFTDYLLIDSLLKNKEYPDRNKRYWDRSCNCWRWAENLQVDRRRYSINMPLSILSWVVENAQKEEDMAKTRERLLGLGRK